MSIDTLAYSKRLKAAGVPEDAADAHAEALNQAVQASVATKADVAMLRADQLAMEARITNKVLYAAIAQTIALGGLFLTLLRFWPHG